jgi:tripartite-type tricarboxylate transporter receptor subunit TctC
MLIRKLALALLGSSLIAAAPAALAQPQGEAWPTKPVRILVGFAPGGGTDIVARLLAQKLSEANGQQFVVENRAGATGMIAAKAAASAPPDGYTLLMGHVNSQAIAPSLTDKAPYDPIKDFTPITYIGFVPNVLTINSATPAKSVQELVAFAKSKTGGISFASPGVGSTNHLAGELMRMESGAPMVHVPYKGSGPAIVDLLGGQVDMNFDAMSSVVQHLKAGKMRALAVTTPKRDPDLPDVPTMLELGYKNFEMTNWYSIMGPASVPAPIVAKLHGQLRTILQMPDVTAKLDELGVRRESKSPEQFAEFVRSENAKYRDIAKRSGVKME